MFVPYGVCRPYDQLPNLCSQYFRPSDILRYIKYLIESDSDINTLNSVSAGIHVYKRPKNRLPYRITNYNG